MSNKSYLPPAIFHDEKQNIHFDTLMEQAQTVISAQSGDLWTDTTAHDPGITLLEALAYNVSDLSYRHLLPLVDLLTPAVGTQGAALFPAGFEPEQMLTTSPITAEDYRKGILDITTVLSSGEVVYEYCDAKVTKDLADKRYRYFYNHDPATGVRNFTFTQVNNDSVPLYLNGSYSVRAKSSFYARLMTNANERRAKLDAYLSENRNICELVRHVYGVSDNGMGGHGLYMDISLNTQPEDVNIAFVELFIVAQKIISPEYDRALTVDFQHQDYTGPRPQQGWLIDIPQEDKSGSFIVYISQVQQVVKSLPFVASVDYINFGADRNKIIFKITGGGGFAISFWGGDPSLTGRISKMLECVTLSYNGRPLTGDIKEISLLLRERMKQPRQATAAPYPTGRYRAPGRYYPASDMLPALYDLQAHEPQEQTRQLHQFLLPFEQQLADGCAQLAEIPALLSFSAPGDVPVWGHQWPFAENSTNDRVHTGYKPATTGADIASQQSISQHIALTNYLQSYFGLPTSENIGLATDAEFLQVQRAALRCLPETGYARTAIQTRQISSLQRRVAARLGIGVMLFDDRPDLSQLPFYIIEHPLLMPREPGKEFINPSPVLNAEQFPAENDAPQRLIITPEIPEIGVSYKLTDKLQPGQLVDLLLGEEEEVETLVALLVAEVSDDAFTLYIDEHEQLRLRWRKVLEIATEGELRWRTSNLWLRDMQFRWVLSDQEGVPPGEKFRITTATDQPWPPTLLPGDTLELKRSFTGVIENTGDEIYTANVDSVDHIQGQAIITLNAPGFDPEADYQWIIRDGVAQALDRFSFTLSFVFKRSLIMNGQVSTDELAEREARIKRIIQEEIPAHLLARVLWLTDGDNQQFSVFGNTYARWQNNATRLGSDAYNLLRMLSIGMLPSLATGIGVMHISSDEEFDALPTDEPQRQQYIDELGLNYVPNLSNVPAKK
ncbi:TPA: hypothetical protein SLG40_003838 [Serratia odorifera]|nr:hypothetical protein [Serratia odorifera]